MKFEMTIRKYKSSDCKDLADLFYHTVHTVNAKDYSEEQLNAWANGNIDLSEWNESFLRHYTVVAEKGEEIIGFGDIDETGYLDRLYVHEEYQNQGIATAICNDLEKAFDVSEITTHASITAKPFFLGRGYQVIKEQQVFRDGIALKNFICKKVFTNKI